MKTIHKHDLGKHAGRIETHTGFEILSLQVQDGKPVLWVKVCTDAALTTKYFVRYGTGWQLDSDELTNEVFVATVQDVDGLVWHWFEVL
jgi:hypothetical protein